MNVLMKFGYVTMLIILHIVSMPIVAATPRLTADQRCNLICGTTCSNFTCPVADIATSARVVAIKALNRMPVDPNKDFPPNIAQFTDAQREEYRQEFAKNIACVFGMPVGWKLAASAATPASPVLGYTKPSIGQLFSRMNIFGSEARITNNYAVGAAHESDLIIRVSNEAINDATTPEDIIENIDAVIPYIELPALYVQTLAEIAGPEAPFSGNSLLTPLNAVARFGLLGSPIPVPGERTTDEWITALSSVTGQEETVTTTGAVVKPFNGADYLNFALRLISLLKQNGITVHKGELLSLGNLTGVNLFQPNELEIRATYDTISPDGPVTIKVIVDNQDGLCIGKENVCGQTPLATFILKKYCGITSSC